MLDYIWSLGDEALRDGRNQAPKPECPSGAATYVLLVSRAITKTEGGRTDPVGAGEGSCGQATWDRVSVPLVPGGNYRHLLGRVGPARNGGPIK